MIELQHHVVGNVHHVADGTQPRPGQPVLQPLGRGPNLQPLDQAGRVAAAQIGVSHRNTRFCLNWRPVLAVADLRRPHLLSGQRADFVGHAQDGETVQPIGGNFQVQDGIPQVVVQGHPQGSVIGQYHDPFVGLAQAQFQLRADHPLGNHAPYSGGFQGFVAAGMCVVQVGSHPGEADALTGGHVGRTADHFHLGPVARVNAAKLQAVGVGMGIHLQHLADAAVLPASQFRNFAHFHPGHR